MSFQSFATVESALAQKRLTVPELYALWNARKPIPPPQTKGGTPGVAQGQFPWLQDGELARQFTAQALKEEEFLLVCDAAQEALRMEAQGDVDTLRALARVRMHYAEALVRLGSTRRACRELEALLVPKWNDNLPRKVRAEIFTALGEVLREESHHAPSPASRTHTLSQALEFYRKALAVDANRIDAAIHVAAVLLILRQMKEAEAQARVVIGLCDEAESRSGAQGPHGPTFETVVARAAAHAVLGEFARAAQTYATLQELPEVTTQEVQMIAEAEDIWRRFGLVWEEKAADGEAWVRPLNIRVGLHTGPVYMHFDPVVRRLGFTGAHVNRAARIEPVTEVGNVYASEEFAALATLNHAKGFACEFAGTMSLAKDFPGRHRIYRVLPVRELPVEALARTVHRLYCQEAYARGESAATNATLRPWEELPEDYREANRAQVRDLPNKLNALGYEIAPAQGMRASEIVIPDALLEKLAMREHERWVSDRVQNGWTYAPVRDNAAQKHPLLVPWAELTQIEKEKDRDAVRNVPALLAHAGFRVRRLETAAP